MKLSKSLSVFLALVMVLQASIPSLTLQLRAQDSQSAVASGTSEAIDSIALTAGAVNAGGEIPLSFEITLNQSYLQSVLDSYAPTGAENATGLDSFVDEEGNPKSEEEILMEIATSPHFQEIVFSGSILSDALKGGFSASGSMENDNRARYEAKAQDGGLDYMLAFDNTVYYTQPATVAFSVNVPLEESEADYKGVVPALSENGGAFELILTAAEAEGDDENIPQDNENAIGNDPPDNSGDNTGDDENTVPNAPKATDTDIHEPEIPEEPEDGEIEEPIIDGETTIVASLTGPESVDSNAITYTYVAEASTGDTLTGAVITDVLPLGLYFTEVTITTKTDSGETQTDSYPLAALGGGENPVVITDEGGVSTFTYTVPERSEGVGYISMSIHTKAHPSEYQKILLTGVPTTFVNAVEIAGNGANDVPYSYTTVPVTTVMSPADMDGGLLTQPMSLAGFIRMGLLPAGLAFSSDPLDLREYSLPQADDDNSIPAAFETLNLRFGQTEQGSGNHQIPVSIEVVLSDEYLIALQDSSMSETAYPDMTFEFTIKNDIFVDGDGTPQGYTFTDAMPLPSGSVSTTIDGEDLVILTYTLEWAAPGTPGESDIIVKATLNRDIYKGYSDVMADVEFDLALNDHVPLETLPNTELKDNKVELSGWHEPALPGDPDEPFVITKTGPSRLTTSTAVNYDITVVARPGSVLNLAEIWDTLPKELAVNSVEVSLGGLPGITYGVDDPVNPLNENTNPKLETVNDSGHDRQKVSYSVTDEEGDITTVKISISAEISEEYRIKYLQAGGASVPISNEAYVKREGATPTYPNADTIASDPVDTQLSFNTFGKSGSHFGMTGDLYEWVITGRTFMYSGSDAYIVDFVDDISVHEYYFDPTHGVTITPKGASDAGNTIIPENHTGTAGDKPGFDDFTGISHVEQIFAYYATAPEAGDAHANHAIYYNVDYIDNGTPKTGQLMIIKLSEETIKNTFKLTYLTEAKEQFDPSKPPGTETELNNLASLYWRWGGGGPEGGVHPDPTLDKGVPLPSNIVTKEGMSFNKANQTATWIVKINERGREFEKFYFSDILAWDYLHLFRINTGGGNVDIDPASPPATLTLVNTGDGAGADITLTHTTLDPTTLSGNYYRIVPDYTIQAGDIGAGIVAGKKALKLEIYINDTIEATDRFDLTLTTKVVDPEALASMNDKSGGKVSNTASFGATFPGDPTPVTNVTNGATLNTWGALITKESIDKTYSFADNSVKWKVTINPNSVHLGHELSITDIMPQGSDFGALTKVTYEPYGIEETLTTPLTQGNDTTITGTGNLKIDIENSEDVQDPSVVNFTYPTKSVLLKFTADGVITAPIILEFTTKIVDEDYIAQEMKDSGTKLDNRVYLEGYVCRYDEGTDSWLDTVVGGAIKIDSTETETDPEKIFADAVKKAKDQAQAAIDARPNTKNGHYTQGSSSKEPDTITWEVFLNRDYTTKLYSNAVITDTFVKDTEDYQYLDYDSFTVYKVDPTKSADTTLKDTLDFPKDAAGMVNTSDTAVFEDITDKILALIDDDTSGNSYIDETGFSFKLPAHGSDPDGLLTSILYMTFKGEIVAKAGTDISKLGNNLSIQYETPNFKDEFIAHPDSTGKVKDNAHAALNPSIVIRKSSTNSGYTVSDNKNGAEYVPDFLLAGAEFTLTGYEYKAGDGTGTLDASDFDPGSIGVGNDPADWVQKGAAKVKTTDSTGTATFPMLRPNMLYVLEETGYPANYTGGYTGGTSQKRYIMVAPSTGGDPTTKGNLPDFNTGYSLEIISKDDNYGTHYRLGADHPNYADLSSSSPNDIYSVTRSGTAQKGKYDNVFVAFNKPVIQAGVEYDIVVKKVIEDDQKPLAGVLLKLTDQHNHLKPRYALTKADGTATFIGVDATFNASTHKGTFHYFIEEVSSQLDATTLAKIAADENDTDIATWSYAALNSVGIQQKGKVQLDYLLDSGTFKYTLKKTTAATDDEMVYLGTSGTKYDGINTIPILTDYYKRGYAKLSKTVTNRLDTTADKLADGLFAVYLRNPSGTVYTNKTTAGDLTQPVAFLTCTDDSTSPVVYQLTDTVPTGLPREDTTVFPTGKTADIYTKNMGTAGFDAPVLLKDGANKFLLLDGTYDVVEVLAPSSAFNDPSGEDVYYWVENTGGVYTDSWFPTYLPVAQRKRHELVISSGNTGGLTTMTVNNHGVSNAIGGIKKHTLTDGTEVVVKGVEFTLYHADNSWNKIQAGSATAVTDGNGKFNFYKVLEGKYILEETGTANAVIIEGTNEKKIPLNQATISYQFAIDQQDNITLSAPTTVPEGYPADLLDSFGSQDFLFLNNRLYDRGPVSLAKVSNIKTYERPDQTSPQYGNGYIGLGGSGFAVYAGNPADASTYDASTGYTDQNKKKPVAYLTNPSGDGKYTLSTIVPSSTLTDYTDIPLNLPSTKGYEEGTQTFDLGGGKTISYMTNEYGYWELLAKDASGNKIQYYAEELIAPQDHFLTLSDGRPATPAEDPNGNAKRMRYAFTIDSPDGNEVKENGEAVIKNFLDYDGFSLLKVASQIHFGDVFKLQGAKFGLYYLGIVPEESNQSAWYSEGSWIMPQSTDAVTNQNGGIMFANLTQGVYALVELDADGGDDGVYVGEANGRSIPYNVDENNKTLIKFDGNNAVYVLSTDANGTPVFEGGLPKWTPLTSDIVFNNERTYDRGTMEVEKTDADDPTKKLNGAEFAVYTADADLLVAYLIDPLAGVEDGKYELSSKNLAGEEVTYHNNSAGIAYLSDEYGKLELLSGSENKYYLMETQTPAGYAPLGADGMNYLYNLSAADPAGARFKYSAEIPASGNLWISGIPNKFAPGIIEGTKTNLAGAPKPLANAVIGLFVPTAPEFTGETAIATYRTEADGKFRFEAVLPGDYLLREISAPSGYLLNKDAIPVTITGDPASLTDGFEVVTDITITNKRIEESSPGDPGVAPPAPPAQPSGGGTDTPPPTTPKEPEPEPETPAPPVPQPLYPFAPAYPQPDEPIDPENPENPVDPTDLESPAEPVVPTDQTQTTPPETTGETTVTVRETTPPSGTTNTTGQSTGKVVRVYNQSTGQYDYYEEYITSAGKTELRLLTASNGRIASATDYRTPRTFDGSWSNNALLLLMGISLLGMGAVGVRVKRREKR